MADDPNVKKLFVYNDETMIRLMDQYWDFFEDATLIPDNNEPYWVVTMKRPKRSNVEASGAGVRPPDVVPVRPEGSLDLSSVFMKRQEQRKKEGAA